MPGLLVGLNNILLQLFLLKYNYHSEKVILFFIKTAIFAANLENRIGNA